MIFKYPVEEPDGQVIEAPILRWLAAGFQESSAPRVPGVDEADYWRAPQLVAWAEVEPDEPPRAWQLAARMTGQRSPGLGWYHVGSATTRTRLGEPFVAHVFARLVGVP